MYESTLPQQTQLSSSADIQSLTKQRLTWLLLVRVILSVGIGFVFVLQATRLRPLYPENSLPSIISVFVAIYIFQSLFYIYFGKITETLFTLLISSVVY